MQKKNVLGKQWFHVFDKQGIEIKLPCSEKEYKDLALHNPNNPSMDGATWKYSFECLLFDTPSGFLSDNEYATDPENGRAIVNQGGTIKSVESSLVVKDELIVSLESLDS